jgi:hypothetical protein
MNKEVSNLASTNPSVRKKKANREYHARGACFIERLIHPADQILTTEIHKTCWLAVVDCLGLSAMEKCILDIELVHRPRARESQRTMRTVAGFTIGLKVSS